MTRCKLSRVMTSKETGNKEGSMECPFFTLYFKNVIEDKGFPIISNQWERVLRPYQHDLMVRSGVDPAIMLGWFVCPTAAMVETIKAVGLEKTPLSLILFLSVVGFKFLSFLMNTL